MGKYLICAEKPDQAKKLALPFSHKRVANYIEIQPCSMFPEGAIVINAIGHLLQACEPEDYREDLKEWRLETLPLVPENMKWKLKPIPGKQKALQQFKKFINDDNISLIIHAADAGREGEMLITEILEYFHNKKPVKRLWTSSLTKEAVIKAFSNLRDIKETMPYYYEALARQRSDYILGLSGTRALSILLKQNVSCGRVQSSLLGIVYQREKEIEEFKSQPFWDCYGMFQFGNHTLIGKWFKEDGEHFFNEETAQVISNYCLHKTARIYHSTKEEKNIRPPQFFNLSVLQSEANRLFGYSTSKTLKIAQSLYEKGILSYPRVEPRHVNTEEAKLFPKILNNLASIESYKELIKEIDREIINDNRFVDDSKTDDHYAIIPTEEVVNPITLPKEEQQLYDLVCQNFIAAHFNDYIYSKSEINTAVDEKFSFKSVGKQTISEGWKTIYKEQSNDENQDEESIELPVLQVGQTGTVLSTELKESKTTPPKRFTEGALIQVMANAGRYVKEKNGVKNELLQLGTPATRSGIVSQLLNREYIKVNKKEVFLLPKGRMVIEAIGQESYLTSVMTTGLMEQTLNEIGKGKRNMQPFIERTILIARELIEKWKEDSKGWDFSSYIEVIQKEKSVGKCPNCGGEVIEKSTFYGCSNFATTQCSFTIPKEKSGVKISKGDIRKLLETGKTSLIQGFKSQNKGKLFDAILAWNSKQKKIVFEFEYKR